MGFRKIYYNKFNNFIHLWETIDGKNKKIAITPNIEYYIPDNTGKSEKKDIWGNSVRLQTSKTIKDMKNFVEFSKIKTCEVSISEDVKFLQKRYLNEQLDVNMGDFQIATIDIELKSGKVFPQNISDIVPYEINLISVHYSKKDEVITYGTQEYTGNSKSVKEYHYLPDERSMLEKFILDFRKKSVDILTGWNIKLFDIPYIINRCKKLNIILTLSPLNIYNDIKVRNFDNKINAYEIAGISILDGLESYKKFTFKKQVNYKLNTIGIVETGQGKLEFEGKINQLYKTDWNLFVEYNIQDVLLTKAIEDKKQLIPLIVGFCYEALIPFERVYSTIALVTGYFIHYLHKKNIMFPDPLDTHKEAYPGGYVYAKPGLFQYLLSYDVESEYPHMIMMYNISPETLVYKPTNTEGLIKTPASKLYECETPNGPFQISGIYYRKDKKGILPEIVENIFNERKYLKQKSRVADGIEKKQDLNEISTNTFLPIDFVERLVNEIKNEGYSATYYESQQQIRKRIIVSLYGVLGNPHFAFYNSINASAITIGGRHLIKYLSNETNMYMKNNWHNSAWKYFPEICKNKTLEQLKDDVVVTVDTDSSYICLDEIIKGFGIKFKDNEQFRQFANIFDKRVLKPFFKNKLDKYVQQFDVPQMINFKREKIILKKLTIKKKKYADLVLDDEGKTKYSDGTLYTDKPKLSKTGIETVRTTTPEFCKEYLDKLLRNIMEKTDINEVTEMLGNIYDDFFDEKIERISKCCSVRNYSKYEFDMDSFLENEKIIYPKYLPQHVKASVNYNYLVAKYNLSLETVGDGTDIKMVFVHPNNELDTEVIGYIGEFPKEFKHIFKINKEKQWEKQFEIILQRFYDVVGWGKVSVDTICSDGFVNFV